MGKEIVYCEICGDRILEQEFERGRAITLLNKNFCQNCKEEAIRNIGIDEALAEMPAPPPPPQRASATSAHMKAVKTPIPVPRTPIPVLKTPQPLPAVPRGATKSHKSPSGTGMRPVVHRPGQNTPLMIGVIVGVVVLCGILVALMMSGGGGTSKGPVDPIGPSTKDPDKPREPDKAALAITRIRALVDAGADPQKVIDECKAAGPAVAGSPHQAELARIEQKARERMEQLQRRRELDKLLADVADLPSKDADFRRYEDAMKWLDRGLDLCRDFPERENDVVETKRRYESRYNVAAEKHFDEVSRRAQALADREQYDDAIAAIERDFPAQFRRSTYWQNLVVQVNRYKANRGDKKPGDPPKDPDPQPQPQPGPQASDNFPAAAPPEPGVWTTVFDGKSMDLWHPVLQAGENADNWKVKDGMLAGASSLANPDKTRGAQDFLVLKYADVTDFELEFKMRTEGEGVVFGGRLVIRGASASCGLTESGEKEWKTYKIKFEGRSITFTKEGVAITGGGADTMPDTGRVFFAIYPGSKVWIKDVKFLRKK